MAAPADTGKASPANAPYTDANIVALLDEANKADSSAGKFALGKAADPGVKAFAKLMMGEHHALLIVREGAISRLAFEDLLIEDGRRLGEEFQLGYLNPGEEVLAV